MFKDENRMGGLKSLFTSANIESVEEWGKKLHDDSTIKITKPVDGLRHFEGSDSDSKIQYSEVILQENRRYTVYG